MYVNLTSVSNRKFTGKKISLCISIQAILEGLPIWIVGLWSRAELEREHYPPSGKSPNTRAATGGSVIGVNCKPGDKKANKQLSNCSFLVHK